MICSNILCSLKIGSVTWRNQETSAATQCNRSVLSVDSSSEHRVY